MEGVEETTDGVLSTGEVRVVDGELGTGGEEAGPKKTVLFAEGECWL